MESKIKKKKTFKFDFEVSLQAGFIKRSENE